jgi:hypothetical protein
LFALSNAFLTVSAGVPEWHAGNPPPPSLMPGTAAASPVPGFISGTASVLEPEKEGDESWLGLVLYSHARPESTKPMYHNAGKMVSMSSQFPS